MQRINSSKLCDAMAYRDCHLYTYDVADKNICLLNFNSPPYEIDNRRVWARMPFGLITMSESRIAADN